MDRKPFVPFTDQDYAHYRPSEDVATALLLDIVRPKHRAARSATPTAASLGLADPRELSNEAVSLADTLTLMAHAAEVGDAATLQDLAVAAGRADWVATQLLALVELGGVR